MGNKGGSRTDPDLDGEGRQRGPVVVPGNNWKSKLWDAWAIDGGLH